jgi:hypothetical protein
LVGFIAATHNLCTASNGVLGKRDLLRQMLLEHQAELPFLAQLHYVCSQVSTQGFVTHPRKQHV